MIVRAWKICMVLVHQFVNKNCEGEELEKSKDTRKSTKKTEREAKKKKEERGKLRRRRR